MGEDEINYYGIVDHHNDIEIPENMWCDSKDDVIESVYDDFDYNFKNLIILKQDTPSCHK